MFRSIAGGKRLVHLTEAFDSDGYGITKVTTFNSRTGIAAESRSVRNYDTGLPKKVYYLEGLPYEAGYLMGCLAEDEISRMMDYTDRVVFSFIGSKVLEKIKLVQEALIRLIYEMSKTTWKQLPKVLTDEIEGIMDGCRKSNPKTRVDLEHLIVLNTGIDIICSMVYSGNFLKRDLLGIEPEDFRIPIMCNAFTVCGRSAGNGYYFGRDFTFPSSDVFQDTAAPVIYNPAGSEANSAWGTAVPFVNITAPGMVGSIAAMNMEGVAFGVNMSPGANCNPGNIGVNSLLMTRMCVQYCRSADEAASLMTRLPRGVSWLYVIADGKSSRSCAAEAGATMPQPDLTMIADEEVRDMLPDMDYIENHRTLPFNNGIMFRWNDYRYPYNYLAFNQQLWQLYNEKHRTAKVLNADAFSQNGYINRTGEQNCPSTFYFAPQREVSDEILVVTNQYIIPEMRYFAMHHWTERIIGVRVNDIQWRYDELNRLIWDTLNTKGSIGFDDAKNLISFLAPYGRNKNYYAENPRSRDGKEIRIEGCVSVFDLKKLIVESHYGYYCDEWVRLTLSEYFK